jgi:predicted amidohydrolase YtcJ
MVSIANRCGWRLGTHAVGNAAIDKMVDAYEFADREHSIRDRRFIVIHGSLMLPDQMNRAKRLGVRVDTQSALLWDKAATIARLLGKAAAGDPASRDDRSYGGRYGGPGHRLSNQSAQSVSRTCPSR